MNPNEAPSDVNTTIDGCTYPGWKMCNFSQAHFFLVNQNTSGNISGTSAAIYKVMEPHSTKWRKAYNNWQWVWQSWWSGRLRHQRFAARTPPVYFNVNYQRRKIRTKARKSLLGLITANNQWLHHLQSLFELRQLEKRTSTKSEDYKIESKKRNEKNPWKFHDNICQINFLLRSIGVSKYRRIIVTVLTTRIFVLF